MQARSFSQSPVIKRYQQFLYFLLLCVSLFSLNNFSLDKKGTQSRQKVLCRGFCLFFFKACAELEEKPVQSWLRPMQIAPTVNWRIHKAEEDGRCSEAAAAMLWQRPEKPFSQMFPEDPVWENAKLRRKSPCVEYQNPSFWMVHVIMLIKKLSKRNQSSCPDKCLNLQRCRFSWKHGKKNSNLVQQHLPVMMLLIS